MSNSEDFIDETLSDLSTDVSSVDSYDGYMDDMGNLLQIKQNQINKLLIILNNNDSLSDIDKERIKKEIEDLEKNVIDVEGEIFTKLSN